MTAKSNYAISVEFLKRWTPIGPWVLTAIDPDKKAIDTATFSLPEEEAMLDWLRMHGRSRNVYFTVNPVTRPMQTKPSREHISALAWMHVDLDPRAGEDLEAERKRILGVLEAPPTGIPRPSVITFSGGGYQGFWRLTEPMPLDGTVEAYEEAKRYNKQLELVLGGDNCHNIDRIMRLPGTVNRPDARKRAKGRVETAAEVVDWTDTTYDLKAFTKAPEIQSAAAPGFAGGTVKVSGNIRRLGSLDELPKTVSDKCKVVINQGHDPDEPGKFGNSRSEWLFFVCCEMVRGECDNDTIYSVITDPDFPISASVLDKGSGTESYAIRQIERAREEAEDPALRELNDKHAVIGSIGSKGLCRILSEERDEVRGRTYVAYQSQSDFLLRYCNRTIDMVVGDGKLISKRAGQWWLDHPRRRYYNTVVFAPGKSVPGSYNLWKGFACDAKPGICERYLDHLCENICGGAAEVYEYVLNWMANTVQNLAQPGQVAIVLRGEKGTGKGVFANHFGRLFGRHYLPVTDPKHLVGSFNAHMRDCILMFADEGFAASDKRAESMLKTLVTEPTLTVEAKGVDVETAPNYVHLIMASNDAWVVPVGPHERRFLVLDVSNSKRQDTSYFGHIDREMRAGGYEALLHLLMTRDIAEFNVFKVPETAALRDQQEWSMSPEDEWWYDKLQGGEVLPGEAWPEVVYCSHLLYDFREELRSSRAWVRTSAHRLAKYLLKVTDGQVVKVQLAPERPLDVVQADGIKREVPRPYAYQIPSLEECRAIWARQGGPCLWAEPAIAHNVYPEMGVTPEEVMWK